MQVLHTSAEREGEGGEREGERGDLQRQDHQSWNIGVINHCGRLLACPAEESFLSAAFSFITSEDANRVSVYW